MVEMKERMSINYDESKGKNKKRDKDKEKNSVPEVVEFANSFAQLTQGKKACWVCGGAHYADKCPLKDKIPQEKKFKEMMQSYYQRTTSSYPYFVNQKATRSTTSMTASSNTDNRSEPIHNQRDATFSWDNFHSIYSWKYHTSRNVWNVLISPLYWTMDRR